MNCETIMTTDIAIASDRVFLLFVHSASQFFDEHYFYLFRAHVRHTGEVRWRFGGVMETSCHLDGTLFPFDSQSCSIIVQSWAYSEAFVQLYNGSNCVHLEHFNDDGT